MALNLSVTSALRFLGLSKRDAVKAFLAMVVREANISRYEEYELWKQHAGFEKEMARFLHSSKHRKMLVGVGTPIFDSLSMKPSALEEVIEGYLKEYSSTYRSLMEDVEDGEADINADNIGEDFVVGILGELKDLVFPDPDGSQDIIQGDRSIAPEGALGRVILTLRGFDSPLLYPETTVTRKVQDMAALSMQS
jgi:hypothetical protein